MLQTIDLCATDEWFVCYKPIVYVIQTYGLRRLKLSFTHSKRYVSYFPLCNIA